MGEITLHVAQTVNTMHKGNNKDDDDSSSTTTTTTNSNNNNLYLQFFY